MTRLTVLLLLLVAITTSACIIEEPRPGPEHDRWCRDHPYRCR
jgi:hypothetical protein